METVLLTIGKTTTPYIKTGIDEYLGRLRRYVPFSIVELPDLKSTRSLSKEQQKQAEGALILKQLKGGDYLVLLDERGEQPTSEKFAQMLRKRMASGIRRLIFVIGGPYGFDKAVYDRADELLSLSRMTFTHEMVRLFFTEQFYRAMTILRGEPYHH